MALTTDFVVTLTGRRSSDCIDAPSQCAQTTAELVRKGIPDSAVRVRPQRSLARAAHVRLVPSSSSEGRCPSPAVGYALIVGSILFFLLGSYAILFSAILPLTGI